MWLVESTDTEESRIQRAECARGWCPSPPVVQEFTVLTESLVYVGHFACITSFSHSFRIIIIPIFQMRRLRHWEIN